MVCKVALCYRWYLSHPAKLSDGLVNDAQATSEAAER